MWNSNDDKRLQAVDNIATYSYGTNTFKLCEWDMLSKYKWLVLMMTQIKTKQDII